MSTLFALGSALAWKKLDAKILHVQSAPTVQQIGSGMPSVTHCCYLDALKYFVCVQATPSDEKVCYEKRNLLLSKEIEQLSILWFMQVSSSH